MPIPSSPRSARLALIGAALLFSTGGAVVKLSTLNPFQIAAGRSFIAALFLLALSSAARRFPRSSAKGLEWLVPLAFGATMLLFVLASRWTTAAGAVLLQATAPLFVLLLSPILLGERWQRRDLWTSAGMALGMLLFFSAPMEPAPTAPRPALGNTLGAITGLTWALAILGLRWMGSESRAASGERRSTSLSCVAMGNVLVVLIALPVAWPIPALDGTQLAILLWLGAFQIGLAYLLVAYGLRSVSAFEASLLFLVEPVLNPLWAWLVHGESVGPLAVLGGALILGCAALTTWRPARRGSAA